MITGRCVFGHDVEQRDPRARAVRALRVRRAPAGGDGLAETPTAGKVGFRLRASGSLRDTGPLRTGTYRDSVPLCARVPACGAAQRVPPR